MANRAKPYTPPHLSGKINVGVGKLPPEMEQIIGRDNITYEDGRVYIDNSAYHVYQAANAIPKTPASKDGASFQDAAIEVATKAANASAALGGAVRGANDWLADKRDAAIDSVKNSLSGDTTGMGNYKNGHMPDAATADANANPRYNTDDPGINAQLKYVDGLPDDAVYPEKYTENDKEYIKTNEAFISKLMLDMYEAGKLEQERSSIRQQTQQLAPDMTGRQATPEQDMFQPRTVSQDEMRAILYPEQAQQQKQAEQAAVLRGGLQGLFNSQNRVGMSADDMLQKFRK